MQNTGGFIVLFIVYHFIRFAYNDYKRAAAEKVYREQLNPAAPVLLEPEKRLEYIVNSKKIPCAFERYYYIKLNMPLPIINIEPAIIERHYQQILQDNKIDVSALNDVEAANRFFIDRTDYLSYFN